MVAAIALALLAPQSDYSYASFVQGMVDLDRLYQARPIAYTEAQASSYDRASTSANDPLTWFANADAGQFIRTEDVFGRKEYVMADLKGPGCITRIWSANPAGRVRFYFDGAERPTFTGKLGDLLSGKIEPFAEPFSYIASRGWNLYAPIPYEKSLKITVDDTDENAARSLYYQIGYRTYPENTPVQSFSLATAIEARQELKAVGETLLDPSKLILPGARSIQRTFLVDPGATMEFCSLEARGKIVQLQLEISEIGGSSKMLQEDWSDPRNIHHILRHLVLEGTFDGQTTVGVPVADFFGVAGGMNKYSTLVMDSDGDSILTCRLPMPFTKSAKLRLVNHSKLEVLINSFIHADAIQPRIEPYLFHAEWIHDRLNTEEKRDMAMLSTEGEGFLVGSMLHISNPTPTWWGEGDEKISIDGAPFPNFFGTGTEDFYGYAWCDPTPFQRPYHAQPRADGPGNRGHTVVCRWHIFDAIPFSHSLKFDMELWHWAKVDVDFDRAVYWYAKPGGRPVRAVDPVDLPLTFIEGIKPVKGAIEGENLEVLEMTGGTREAQAGFFELSNGRQLWWKGMAEGDRLSLKVPVAEPGTYEIVGSFCGNKDYGIHEIRIGNQTTGRLDFFSETLGWTKRTLGTYELQAGDLRIDVISAGRRPAAAPGNMFGLDYLMLIKK